MTRMKSKDRHSEYLTQHGLYAEQNRAHNPTALSAQEFKHSCATTEKRLTPRSRESELTVRGNDNILHKVVVASQGTLGDTIVFFIAGKLPHNNSLVTGRREDGVWGFGRGGNGGDPASVSFESASVNKRFSHLKV